MQKINFIDIKTEQSITNEPLRVNNIDTLPMKGDGIILNGAKYKVMYRNYEYYNTTKDSSTLLLKCIHIYVKIF